MTNGNNFFVNRKQNLTLMSSLIRFGIYYPLDLNSEQTLNWEPKILQITANTANIATLNSIRIKNVDKLVTENLNINSLTLKFDKLKTLVIGKSIFS